MNENIHSLNKIYEKVKELNRQNNLLKDKYSNDPKYARIHKRLLEDKGFSETERKIFDALNGVKLLADDKVLENNQILNNESYFELLMMPLVIDQFKEKQGINLDAHSSKHINNLVVKEYTYEFNNGMKTW